MSRKSLEKMRVASARYKICISKLFNDDDIWVWG